ncbi:hypothetical protein LCGC14_0161900 [marine sediment metagenome]|uniref:PEP-CTERM protein-sorting domain-containing protein n=1 Tax=marine sediment metagenome TaxID=412755 RepID=A0A0F9UV74_9ZZZZ|nr:PEP-CTERM sorting domain-containing protein [Phycisphaerae bacterium]HDZ45047.1 PEP-CTERM sorting domain-containing protein [Phycisphaerae bacterium]
MKNCAIAITAVCLLIAAGADGAVVVDNDLFPVVAGRYSSDDMVDFPAYEVEILSMDLVADDSAINSAPPPGPGESFAVDSFFDITVEMSYGGVSFDVFFDIPTTLSITNPGGDSGEGPQTYQIELISMVLTGTFDDGTSFILQESPSLASTGEHIIEFMPDDNWQIDSFFDVYFELTVGGGPFEAASGPLHMTLVPEPATMSLFIASGACLLKRRRTR